MANLFYLTSLTSLFDHCIPDVGGLPQAERETQKTQETKVERLKGLSQLGSAHRCIRH